VKQTRAAAIRRRRLATTGSVAALLTAGVVIATQLPAHSHAHTPSSTSPPTGAVPTSAASTTSATLRQAIESYVATRKGAISAAVYDDVSKQLTVIHPKVRGRTASIVKADILETLLHRTEGHLSEEQRETATSMIENSDNDSATDLWDQDGGAPGVTAYNTDVGLTQTEPNVDWGDTTTSASDQVTLIRTLLRHSSLLTDSARSFQRGLMRHVEADQRWGISGGVPKGIVIGIKNGWLPVDEDHDLWAVNSIGWVHGDGKRYEIAVITQHNATEGYGINTIQHIARLAWKDVGEASSS
jgi:hypothetical protein